MNIHMVHVSTDDSLRPHVSTTGIEMERTDARYFWADKLQRVIKQAEGAFRDVSITLDNNSKPRDR